MTHEPSGAHSEPAEIHLDDEQRARVLYSLMGILARLVHLFDLRLKDVSQLLETACFHYLRQRGYKLDEIAGRFEISPRKASMLSRQLKDGFFRAEREHGLPRRIEFLLWAEPMSAARIAQLLRGEEEEEAIKEAIEELLEQDRIRLASGHHVPTYELDKQASRMYRDAFDTKIDGLNHYASQVANVTAGRFAFEDPRTFARTVTLRVLPEDLDTLQQLYQHTVWPTLTEIDARAAAAIERREKTSSHTGQEPPAREAATDAPEPFDLSISWTPYQLIENKKK